MTRVLVTVISKTQRKNAFLSVCTEAISLVDFHRWSLRDKIWFKTSALHSTNDENSYARYHYNLDRHSALINSCI